MSRDDESLRDIEYLKRFLKRKTNDDQHRTSIVHDKIDQNAMQQALEDVEQFKDLEASMADEFENGSPLTADMWQAMHKAAPVVRDEDEMRPDSLITREAIKEMMKLREFEDLKDFTTGDATAAGLAASTMGPHVEKIMGDLQEKQDALNELLEQLENQDPDDPMSDEELEEALEGLGDGLGGMRADMRKAVQDATDEMENMEGMANLWGTDPGELKRMPAQERIALANRLRNNPNLARIAELIGAFQNFALAMQHRKTNELQTDIYDIETGNDLSHVLPTEFSLRAREVTKKEFNRRFHEGGLLQYRLHGREKVGKGGIVCEIDTSGSMGGERDVFAKAVGLTLLRIAHRQDRTFHGVLFSTASEVKHFDLTHAGPNAIMDFATFSWGGGTDFQAPLNMGMEILEEEHAREGCLKSDIVFITDGQCSVSDEFLARLQDFKDRLGCRIFGVVIGSETHTEPLHTICDGRVWPIANLNKPDDMANIFQNV